MSWRKPPCICISNKLLYWPSSFYFALWYHANLATFLLCSINTVYYYHMALYATMILANPSNVTWRCRWSGKLNYTYTSIFVHQWSSFSVQGCWPLASISQLVCHTFDYRSYSSNVTGNLESKLRYNLQSSWQTILLFFNHLCYMFGYQIWICCGSRLPCRCVMAYFLRACCPRTLKTARTPRSRMEMLPLASYKQGWGWGLMQH